MAGFRTGGPFGPRGTRPGGFGAGMGLSGAIKALLIANVAVFVVQQFVPVDRRGYDLLTSLFAFTPGQAILGAEIWRFFTYMFLHGDFTHILVNMFILWMFGGQIEARWGRNAFLTYYVVCGLGGAAVYGLLNLFGVDAYVPMLGASGAVYGILLAYGLTFPNAVILIFFIFPMKAKYAVVLLGLMELLLTASATGGNVAHLAHLGGMITGLIFLRLTVPSLAVTGASGFGDAWRRFRMKRRLRVVKPEKPEKGGNGSAPRNEGRSSRVDVILDKISREGLDSLTDEEQEILRRAGRR